MRSRRDNLVCRRSGYTLIELVLVMAILCLAVGLVAPSLRDFSQGREAQNAAEQFVAVAQWGHAQAIARGEVYRINVDLHSKTYWLTVQQGGQFVPPGEEFGITFVVPDTVSMDCDFRSQPDGMYVEFEPTGRTDEGNLRFTGAGGELVQVGCMTTTDQFQVYPPNPSQPITWGVHHGAKDLVGGANP